MQDSWTFQKPPKPDMVFYGKLVMSQHATIEQYQTYKTTFIRTNIYKLQIIKLQYNSPCYTFSLLSKKMPVMLIRNKHYSDIKSNVRD